MAVAHAILALLALANQPTPRHALRDATHDTRPDSIPRARDARAPPEHQAHTVLANTLLHTDCSSTHRTMHTPETSARTSAPACHGRPGPTCMQHWLHCDCSIYMQRWLVGW